MSAPRNPLLLLLFSALCVIGAVVLAMAGHPVPIWLTQLAGAGVLGGAAVMTPGLQTVERVLAATAAQSPTQPSTPLPAPVTPATPVSGGSDPFLASDFAPELGTVPASPISPTIITPAVGS
jgi:hypothetical protein